MTFSLLKGWLPPIDAQRVFVANSQEVLSQMHRDGLFRAGAGADYVETLSDYRAVKSSGSITQKFMVGVTQKVECSYYFLKRGAGENPSTLWVI